MPTFGPDRADCHVLVFREGLLSAVGHDLVLRAGGVSVELAGDRSAVRVEVDARTLRVRHAVRGGRELPDALRPSDRQDIEAAIRGAVLQSDRFPAIRFASTGVAPRGAGWDVRGSLTVAGATREVAFQVRRVDGRLEAEGTLHQPDFGIRPYRAMLGALKVRADVLVRVSIPDET